MPSRSFEALEKRVTHLEVLLSLLLPDVQTTPEGVFTLTWADGAEMIYHGEKLVSYRVVREEEWRLRVKVGKQLIRLRSTPPG